jgi:DNA invertase Pin-like site-specific DNA recombinase
MKAVIYARYSCDNQREESIEGQLRECRDFAAKKDMTVVGTYIDRAMSAKTDNRPEFQRMIAESGKNMFDTVIVWKLDRFARNRYDSARYKMLLRKNGVKVVSATEVISEGAEGIILESVLEGYAEYYSAELSEKVIRGMTENALKKQYNGGNVPTGYYIDEQKHYQIDKLVAPFIREAFQMYINNRPIKDIVAYLNENHVTTCKNKPFTKTSVSAMLQVRKYMGEYRYRDVVFEDGIPAIITKEMFNMAQQRLEKNRYAPACMKADTTYLLTTKLVCGHCGAFMVGESGTGRENKKYHYYKCVSAKKKKGCPKRTIRKEFIENLVVDSVVRNLFNPDTIDRISDAVMAEQDKESTVIPLLERELAETEKTLNNVMAAIEQGIITDTTKRRMKELEAKKSEIETKIIREEIKERRLTKEQIVAWLTRLTELDLADEGNKLRIIETYVNSVYAYDDKIVVNFNCREEPETVPLPLKIVTDVSDLLTVGEPLVFTRETACRAASRDFNFIGF